MCSTYVLRFFVLHMRFLYDMLSLPMLSKFVGSWLVLYMGVSLGWIVFSVILPSITVFDMVDVISSPC